MHLTIYLQESNADLNFEKCTLMKKFQNTLLKKNTIPKNTELNNLM